MDQILSSSEPLPVLLLSSSRLSSRFLRLKPYLMTTPCQRKDDSYYECSFTIQNKRNQHYGIYKFMKPTFEEECSCKAETASCDESERKLRVRKSTYFLEKYHIQQEQQESLQSEIGQRKKSQWAEKKKNVRSIGINLPKIAALIFHITIGSQALIKITKKSDPETWKILLAKVFAKITHNVSDEVFNWAIKQPERDFIKYIESMRVHFQVKSLQSFVTSVERESSLQAGMITKIVEDLKAQKNLLTSLKSMTQMKTKCKDEQESQNLKNQQHCHLDILKPSGQEIKNSQAESYSLIQQLYQQGAFLHPEFKKQLQADKLGSELIKKASNTLFKLPYVTASRQSNLIHFFLLKGEECLVHDQLKQTYLKLLLQRGPLYMSKLGVDVSMRRVYRWVQSGVKVRTSSGRPVQNILLDKVAMSSIYSMIQKGLLPHFDYLIAKQIAAYLDGENESTRSEGWKRKFNARYKRLEASKSLDYFEYPIPEAYQLEFLEQFKQELHSKARYLSYKKKSLYSWLYSNQ